VKEGDMSHRGVRTVQVLLTITAFEFFGPVVRDYSPSHALNPAWVGHARLHLVWLLGFMLFSGVVNLWLIWGRRPVERRDLRLSAAWQCCNLGGFWVSYALADAYGGLVTVPGEHIDVLGWDENVFVFMILSIVMAAALALLALGGRAASPPLRSGGG
jgi:hypothetical protein